MADAASKAASRPRRLRNNFNPVEEARAVLRRRPMFWPGPLAFHDEKFWCWRGDDPSDIDAAAAKTSAKGRWEIEPRMRYLLVYVAMEQRGITPTRANRDELIEALKALCYVPEWMIEGNADRIPNPWKIKWQHPRWQGALCWHGWKPEESSA